MTGATSGRLGQDALGFFSSDTNGASIRFGTNNGSQNEWMRITSGGNVGLGTASPQQPVTVGASKVLAMEMPAPGAPTLTPQSGGSLATGTYYYKITALDGTGETVGGTEASITLSGSNHTVKVDWSAVAGAASYRIYRGTTSGGENTYYSWTPTSTQVTTFSDTGASGSSGSPPSSTTAYTMKFNPGGNVQIGNQSGDKNAWQTLLLGTNAAKQMNQYGPEMITAAGTNINDDNVDRRVVIWAGSASDTEAQFLLNSTGMLEWGAGGSNDQDINLRRIAANQLALYGGSLGLSYATDAQPRIFLRYDGGGIFLGGGSSNPDFNLFRYGPFPTTDATPTALVTVGLTDQFAYRIVVEVVARKSTGGDRAFFYLAALAYRQGGGAVIEGSVANVIPAIKSSGGSGWACTIAASGNNIIVQVTGQASTTVDWSATVEYQQVS